MLFLFFAILTLHFGDLNHGLGTDVNKTGLYREGTYLLRRLVAGLTTIVLEYTICNKFILSLAFILSTVPKEHSCTVTSFPYPGGRRSQPAFSGELHLYICSRIYTPLPMLLSICYCSYSIKKKQTENKPQLSTTPLCFQDGKYLLSSCIRAKICTSVTSFSL